jgi:hypothetical protein
MAIFQSYAILMQRAMLPTTQTIRMLQHPNKNKQPLHAIAMKSHAIFLYETS